MKQHHVTVNQIQTTGSLLGPADYYKMCVSLFSCVYLEGDSPTHCGGLYNGLSTCMLKGATWWLATAVTQIERNPAQSVA